MRVHTWSHKNLNGVLCGAPGGVVTGHFEGITCKRCKRIILKNVKLCEYYKVKEFLLKPV